MPAKAITFSCEFCDLGAIVLSLCNLCFRCYKCLRYCSCILRANSHNKFNI